MSEYKHDNGQLISTSAVMPAPSSVNIEGKSGSGNDDAFAILGVKERGWAYAQDALGLSGRDDLLGVIIAALTLLLGDVFHALASFVLRREKVAVVSTPEGDRPIPTASTTDIVDLDTAVSLCRQAMLAAPPDHRSSFVPRVTDLARALMIRYGTEGCLVDLDAQVELCNEVLDHLGPTDPARAMLLCALVEPLRVRAAPRGTPADLHRSIELCREVLALSPPDTPERERALDELGSGLQGRYKEAGSEQDLEDAVRLHEEALQLRPLGHARRHRALSNSAVALMLRYGCSGRAEDLELALVRHREALVLRPRGHPERYASLNQLGIALATHFETRGDLKTLDESVRMFEESLDALPPGHQEREHGLANLAGVLTYRFLRYDDIRDLDRSVDLLLASLEIRKPGNAFRPHSLANLANALQARFSHSGNGEDLDMAIALHRELVETADQTDPNRTFHLSNLAHALLKRFRLVGAVGDLDEAVASAEAGLALRPKDHPRRCDAMDNLARSLIIRFEKQEDDSDLDRAMALHREALATSHADNYDRHVWLCKLAHSHELRFCRRGQNEEDATLALTLTMQALETLPAGHAGRSKCLFQLSRLYLLPNTSFNNTTTALQTLREAITDTHRNAQPRLIDGLLVLQYLGDQPWDEATRVLILEVHSLLLRLLPRVAYFGLDLRSRLRTLQKAERLANDAAAHALVLAQPTAAVELSEEGRGVFWTQALQLRTPFDDLPPALSKQLIAMSRQLEEGSHSDPDEHRSPTDAADQRRRLGLKFEELLDEVRALPGLERFMLPDKYASLRAAARDGPVVILVCSHVACQAIILEASEAEARQLPLAITLERLHRMSVLAQDESARQRSAQRQRGMKLVYSSADSSYALLSELWRSVVFPIIGALGLKPSFGRERPRLWWCPTGPFASLPLHAAGIYEGNRADNCSNYFVSSYTPTLRALISARQPFKFTSDRPWALIAAVPRPPAKPPLPHAIEEVRSVKETIPAELIVKLPLDEDAACDPSAGVTIQTLKDELPETSILHLASHGQQDYDMPLESGFVMQDGLLTVANLMQLELPHAAFAFLSACETAMGDKAQPDQTVHLAAAMMFAGFRSVVGTMWAMGDQDGPVVAQAVYGALFKDADLDLSAVPYALDDAICALRTDGLHPSRWATYVHLGA